MPQAVSPGSFAMLFSQELLKSMMMQSMSMLGGGGVQASLQLGGQRPVTNPAVVTQVDSVVRNSITSMDSQLASVGISLSGLGLGGSTFTTAKNGPIPRPDIPAGQTALTAGRMLGQPGALPGASPVGGAPLGASALGASPLNASSLGLGSTSITSSLLNPVGATSLPGTPPASPLAAMPTVVRAADVGSAFSAVI